MKVAVRTSSLLEVAIFLYQTGDGTFKVSTRSKEIVDLAQIAVKYDGGGHKRAAACTVSASSITEAEQKVISEIARLWNK